MSKLLAIFEAILGEAEQIVPMFIHNPVSQKIEAVVVTTINGALSAFSSTASAGSTTATSAGSTPFPV